MPMILYHSTTRESVEGIVRDGFRDPDPDHPRTRFAGEIGVWLSDAPKSSTMNVAQGDWLLEVTLDLTEAELAQWEDVDPQGPSEPGDREWCIPAEIVNQRGKVRLLGEEEADEVREIHWGLSPVHLRAQRERRRSKA